MGIVKLELNYTCSEPEPLADDGPNTCAEGRLWGEAFHGCISNFRGTILFQSETFLRM